MAGLFQVLYGKQDGGFKPAEALNGTDGEPLIIPISGEDEQVKNICTRPTAADWDNDGDLDLVVGNFEGTFFLFHGEGDGKFAPKPEQITTEDGSELRVKEAHSDPAVADWDGDGDLDIISGTAQGGAFWAENTAGPDKTPALKAFVELIPAVGSNMSSGLTKVEDLKGCGAGTRVWIADADSDGKLDLLVGDNVTLTSPAEGLSTEEFKKKQSAWQAEFDKSNAVMQGFDWSSGDEPTEEMKDARKKFSQLYAARSEFIEEQSTGFVWFYRRK